MTLALSVKVIYNALCILIDVIVLFLNPLIINIIYKDRLLRRQPSATYITNLAFADMFVAGTNLANLLFHFLDLGKILPVCIILYGFFSQSMINASLLFMLANSIDRFVFIKMSLHYHAIMNLSLVKSAVVGIWFFSSILPFFPYVIIDHAWEYASCPEVFRSQVNRHFHLFLAAIFTFTIVLTAIMFVSVFRVVKNSRRLRQLPMRTFSTDTMASSIPSGISFSNTGPDSPTSFLPELTPYRHEQGRSLTSQTGEDDSTGSFEAEDYNGLHKHDDFYIYLPTAVAKDQSSHDLDIKETLAEETRFPGIITITPSPSFLPSALCMEQKSGKCHRHKRGHKRRSSMENGLKRQRHGLATRREFERSHSRLEALNLEMNTPKMRFEKDKGGCLGKAVTRIENLTHLWCSQPKTAVWNLYNFDMPHVNTSAPNSIFVFNDFSDHKDNEGMKGRDSKQTSETPHMPAENVDPGRPRVDCVAWNGTYSFFIESSLLVSEINRSIAACVGGSLVCCKPEKITTVAQSHQRPIFELFTQSQSSSPSTDNVTETSSSSACKTSPRTETNSSMLADDKPSPRTSSSLSTTSSSALSESYRSAIGKITSGRSHSTSTSSAPSSPYGVSTYSGRDIRTLKILFFMFCVYIFLWLPTFLINLLRSVDIEVSLEVSVICYTIGVSNSVFNFFVYPMRIPRLKLVFKQLLKKACRGARKQLKRKCLAVFKFKSR